MAKTSSGTGNPRTRAISPDSSSAINARSPWPAPRNFSTYSPSSSASTRAGSDPPSRSGVTYRVTATVLFRRNVTPLPSRLQSFLIEPDVDLVDLAVACGRRISQQVLAVQLVDDMREGGQQVLAVADLDVAAAGLLRDAGQPGIGQVRHQRRLQSAGSCARRHRSPLAAVHADAVDHHVVGARAVDDVGLARDALAEPDRSAVFAVTEDEDGAPLIRRVAKCGHRLIDRAPQRCRRIRLDIGRDCGPQFIAGAREVRADDDLAAEAADARQVGGPEPGDQRVGGAAQQRQVAFHAPGHVEQDDQPDRLRAVVEDRQRLGLALVADLEVVLAQRGDDASLVIGDGDEHAHRLAGAAKHRLLRAEAGEREKKCNSYRSKLKRARYHSYEGSAQWRATYEERHREPVLHGRRRAQAHSSICVRVSAPVCASSVKIEASRSGRSRSRRRSSCRFSRASSVTTSPTGPLGSSSVRTFAPTRMQSVSIPTWWSASFSRRTNSLSRSSRPLRGRRAFAAWSGPRWDRCRVSAAIL